MFIIKSKGFHFLLFTALFFSPPVFSLNSTPAKKQNASVKALQKPGLSNFYQVTKTLYRGAQPEAEGFQQLKNLGIKTVVNLRSMHSDLNTLGETHLHYEAIPMVTWHPEEEDVVRFLKIATDLKNTPVFVHCQHGSDRTGVIVASYRIAVCGWSKSDAIQEMTQGPFGFHPIWQDLVQFIQGLDVKKLKKEIGPLAPSTVAMLCAE